MINNSIGTCILSDDDLPNLYLIQKTLNQNIISSKLDVVSNQYEIKSSNNFKLILENYIQCINSGAKVLLYKYKNENMYYYEIHKKILCSENNVELYLLNNHIYSTLKKLNNKLNPFIYIYYSFISKIISFLLKKINIYISDNIGFEINKGSFERVKKSMISNFLKINDPINLIKKYFYYKKKFMLIPLDKPKNCLKTVLLGDYKSYIIEKQLASKNIKSYKIDDNYSNRFFQKYYLFKLRRYSKNTLNTNETYILNKLMILLKNCDGVIYIRDFYNSEKIVFLKILEELCKNNKKTLFFINIDEKTTNEAIDSKIDVFKDMITIKTY